MSPDTEEQTGLTIYLHPVIAWIILVTKIESGLRTRTFPVVHGDEGNNLIPLPEDVKNIRIVQSWPDTFLAKATVGAETIDMGIHVSPDVEALKKEAIELIKHKGSLRMAKKDAERESIVSGWFQSKFQSELLNLKKGWRIRGIVRAESPESKTLFNIELIKRVERRKDASHLRSGVFTPYQKSRIEDIPLSQRKIEPGEVDVPIPYDGIYRIAISPNVKTTYFVELFVEKGS